MTPLRGVKGRNAPYYVPYYSLRDKNAQDEGICVVYRVDEQFIVVFDLI